MFEKILASLDGSELSEAVIPYSETIARLFDSEVNLVGVDAEPHHTLDRVYSGYLNAFAKRLQYKEIKAQAVHLHGKPEVEIINFANKHDISLIIMSTRGAHSTEKGIVGGVSEKVLRVTSRPLMLIPEKMPQRDAGEFPFRKILVPLDGSELGEAALPYATALCRKMVARLYVLHIMMPAYRITGGMDYAVKLQQQLVGTLRHQATQYLNRIGAELDRENLDVKYDLVSGYASATILDFTRNNAIDLIAMASHGKGGMQRFVMGSTADKVVHNSTKPVIFVRVKEEIDY